MTTIAERAFASARMIGQRLRADSVVSDATDLLARLLRRPWLTDEQRRWRTAQRGLYHRIVWSPPKDALAKGWATTDEDQDAVKGLNAALEVGSALTRARAAARQDGGAWLWPAIAGADDWSKPLPPGPHPISALHVLTRSEVDRVDVERDALSKNWAQASLVALRVVRDGFSWTAPRVHVSRLIYVPGAAATENQETGKEGYDLPVLELYRDALDAYLAGLGKTGRLLDRLSQPWVRLKEGRPMMAGGGDTAGDSVTERLQLLKDGMGGPGLLVLLGEDEAGWSGPSLAGVRDAVNVLAEQLSGVEGWPLSDLFGQPPGGLSTDDESGRRAKAAMLTHERALLADALLALYRIGLGEAPDREIVWPELWEPTEIDAAEASLKRAQRDEVLVNIQAIGPDESRERVRNEEPGIPLDAGDIEREEPDEPEEEPEDEAEPT